ncbi:MULTISPECIES: Rne/Rng family ribonuclease [unclassified Clostridioides]|uniref:Rne/Rng family ribonuclease n=1 Tax=unclassified Clostridioides TaxID=2635829 RepID=UPI001D0C9C76|nr:Rne/Rng family ribonuclease [Clostridioides sp. ES-S-0049-03]MCC0651649.1 Rne/Rng family ribonuclease [Clostridioides sp. ES-S-0001-03]MCC0657457.1 Rne/Rng family ribonuclease [Clostridioides sp. ES-S-0123-01]MCC0672863.1 Rne/Rng family ribonuclease [Clostridioides sp. ES-S-0145-01]MCC0676769.1 Rne/Rng family ribonuclease [Clostridioides sp. ES-W-0018-02]MCC0678733.1 Rne/Rng family ribonuclease [Clostridioides sp. ES-S-0005-03]MCC0694038.1 Rne/Rng family ribonuclease [Clostridioides sp. ES
MKKIVIESLIGSQKTAVLEDGKLVELFVEDNLNKKTVSNIYRGIVKKVIPGIEACFVDIGFKKLAYLQLKKESTIKSGQEILVQVNKEEIGTKGAKLNTEISISGRYIVYIPSNDRTTISNKITDERERFRLKKITKAVNKENLGLIIRTEAQGCTHDEIKKDIEELKLKYDNILKEYKLGMGPKLLYKSLDFATKYVKDNVNDEIESIIINNYDKYHELKPILKLINNDYIDKLYLEENKDVFDLYRIESQIEKLLNEKVWLKSGGYLIIEKTEALTVIDVNTGKFVGTGKLDETVYKTNIEAAKEIVRQLRIRDIAGIIIIDFIDMYKKKYQNEVLHILEEEFSKDKRKAEVLGMTKLGLVEVARRREKESIDKYYLMACPCCDGTKTIKSIHHIVDSVEKEIMRISEHTVYKNVIIEFNDFVFKQIKEDYMDIIDKIGEKYNMKISLNANCALKHNKTNVIFDKIVDNKM